MREIVLDTETTGLDPHDGHRLVEVACVELFNFVPTGKHLHIYINPERDVPHEAAAVHGLTGKFLADKPLFSQIYTDLLDFIGGDPLVIHNAEFDVRFLNHELRTVGHPGLASKVIDTIHICRQRFPGSPANLDAVCRRFNIDNSGREFHGALLDSQLLAEVYLELMGGRQHGLGLAAEKTGPDQAMTFITQTARKTRAPRIYVSSPDDLVAHARLLRQLAAPLWADYEDSSTAP